MRPDINNKTRENHALKTVRLSTSQIHGEPIQHVNRKTDKRINDTVDKLNDYMEGVHQQARDIKLGSFQSVVRTVHKITPKGKSIGIVPFRIHIPNPLNITVVYPVKDDSDMLSIQVLKDERDEQYYQCYLDDLCFIIKVGRATDFGIDGFGDIPITEHPNNPDRLSDIEIVITFFDQVNKMRFDCMNGTEQLIQAFIPSKNCEINEKKSLQVCDPGAVEVKDLGQGMQPDVKLTVIGLSQQ